MANIKYPVNGRSLSVSDITRTRLIGDEKRKALPYKVDAPHLLPTIGDIPKANYYHADIMTEQDDDFRQMDFGKFKLDKGLSDVDVDDKTEEPEMYNLGIAESVLFHVDVAFPDDFCKYTTGALSPTITDGRYTLAYNDNKPSLAYYPNTGGTVLGSKTLDDVENTGYRNNAISCAVTSCYDNTYEPISIRVSADAPKGKGSSKTFPDNTLTSKVYVPGTSDDIGDVAVGYGVSFAPAYPNNTGYILEYDVTISQENTGSSKQVLFRQMPPSFTIRQGYSANANNYHRFVSQGVYVPNHAIMKGKAGTDAYTEESQYYALYRNMATVNNRSGKGCTIDVTAIQDNDIIYTWTTIMSKPYLYDLDNRCTETSLSTEYGTHDDRLATKLSLNLYVNDVL